MTRATTVQEYFWYLRASDPEPSAYALQLALAIDGPLDRGKLAAATEACIARHSVFRTALAEVGGTLIQRIADPAPFRLELDDRAGLPPREQDAAIAEVGAALVATADDLAGGCAMRGRLIAFSPERHALMLMADHAIADAASLALLQREILVAYGRGAVPDGPPPRQYIDYAAALAQFAGSAEGRARRDWWRTTLDGARGVALPGDRARTELDARRARAPLGIVSDVMLPTLSVAVPPQTRDRIAALAAEAQTSAAVVYLAALVWLVRDVAGHDDIAIENVHNPRGEPGVEQLQGAVVTWTLLRCRVAGCATLGDAILRVKDVMRDAIANTPVPEYYATVPAELRGIAFNYMPAAWGKPGKVGALEVGRWPRPFPRYRRHWELMTFVVDSLQGGQVNFTGNARLFEPASVRALADRYLALLTPSARP